MIVAILLVAAVLAGMILGYFAGLHHGCQLALDDVNRLLADVANSPPSHPKLLR